MHATVETIIEKIATKIATIETIIATMKTMQTLMITKHHLNIKWHRDSNLKVSSDIVWLLFDLFVYKHTILPM